MQTIIHHAADRGVGEHDWLSTRYSFSFADWYDSSRMGFGALRVLNDDRIDPASGFPPHAHRDMEIITIVTAGAVNHHDSMGNQGIVREGDVQVMSAGTGVVHSEYNKHTSEELRLFQLWIQPDKVGYTPRYAQHSFKEPSRRIELLVGPEGASAPLWIHQNAYISRMNLLKGETAQYQLHDPRNGVYIFVISGSFSAAGIPLATRDALAIQEVTEIEFTCSNDAHALLIEVPLT